MVVVVVGSLCCGCVWCVTVSLVAAIERCAQRRILSLRLVAGRLPRTSTAAGSVICAVAPQHRMRVDQTTEACAASDTATEPSGRRRTHRPSLRCGPVLLRCGESGARVHAPVAPPLCCCRVPHSSPCAAVGCVDRAGRAVQLDVRAAAARRSTQRKEAKNRQRCC